MSNIIFVYDTRERAIKDTLIAEFSKPHYFAKTKGTIAIEEKQLPVADYVIILNGKIVAVVERKTLNDYAASFKDRRHENKSKLLNLRNKCGCRIYYIVEGAVNPEYTTEYAGIKYQNILASMQDLMISDNIHVITTCNAQHTAKSLKMLCESYIRVSLDKDKIVNGPWLDRTTHGLTAEPPIASDCCTESNTLAETAVNDQSVTNTSTFSADEPAITNSECYTAEDSNISTVNDNDLAVQQSQYVIAGSAEQASNHRVPITVEEMLRNANHTPEEKLMRNRIEAWSKINGVSLASAAIIAKQYKLSDWITGKISADDANKFTFNGRKNNKFVAAVTSRPNLEMQIAILSAMNGYTVASATELLGQYSLDDILNDRDYSHVRLGKRSTKISDKKIKKIKEFLCEKN